MPNPFDNPLLLLGNPSPYSLELSPYLLGNPPSVTWRESLSTLIPGWLYTDPSPLPPHSLFPLPNGSSSQMHALLRRHCHIGFTQSDTDTDAVNTHSAVPAGFHTSQLDLTTSYSTRFPIRTGFQLRR
jgi:hypothetical protein